MNIVKIAPMGNGAHMNQSGEHINAVPYGWAVIPEDFPVPDSFPFVTIEAEEREHIRETEDGEGKKISVPVTLMTVIAMAELPVPEAPEPEPTADEKRDAQIFYTAMMTDTLLEEV